MIHYMILITIIFMGFNQYSHSSYWGPHIVGIGLPHLGWWSQVTNVEETTIRITDIKDQVSPQSIGVQQYLSVAREGVFIMFIRCYLNNCIVPGFNWKVFHVYFMAIIIIFCHHEQLQDFHQCNCSSHEYFKHFPFDPMALDPGQHVPLKYVRQTHIVMT